MSKIEKLDKEHLDLILVARDKAAAASAEAEKLVSAARIAELEFRVTVQEVFLANGLDPNCRVDQTTGNITWPAPAEVVETTAAAIEEKKE
jgi:hypothetical protein